MPFRTPRHSSKNNPKTHDHDVHSTMPRESNNFNDRWVQAQRKATKSAIIYACKFCPNRHVFMSEPELWDHCLNNHPERLPAGNTELLDNFRKIFQTDCLQKQPPSKDNSQPRKPILNESNKTPGEPPPPFAVQIQKRERDDTQAQPTSSISAIRDLTIEGQDVSMQDASDEDQPRKRAATGDGISNGSGSPFRDSSPAPRRSKARPISQSQNSLSEGNAMFGTNIARPPVSGAQLWTDTDAPMPRSSATDPSNIASVQAQRVRAQALQQRSPQKPFQNPSQRHSYQSNNPPTSIVNRSASSQSLPPSNEENTEFILQPETRPISQEQLVAEVKGIYAGLVMVEAKCIEVDNKQAALAQPDGSQPKLNNEQWQALIALHRTLLHEHHDFFLASQHPSASQALRRLASKYAMPARMWRHGIHSFLELLRHRLPASLDHMLAFIYLAYSMVALLFETVPAFEDTWIECLGDLGRYRMAIEDDDIRDREVWTGVARHWYSKASDKAPTTGRLYHHLAILARPNALQQLFYYSKSLCVQTPFGSARESILTLFEPVLNADHSSGQYRLPPLDMAFVKSHGMLFTGRDMHKFDGTMNEFLGLLDGQIGRVTRKFMEQGFHISIANSVAMLGFAAEDNILMKATSTKSEEDVPMTGNTSDEHSQSMIAFRHAERLSNETLKIVLSRIGDPNVLPFVHCTLVFLYNMSRHPAAMSLLQAEYPWDLLSILLNTLLPSYTTPNRIEDERFPLPEKDDVRPFPEDFAMRGLLWADNYFPDAWFTNEKIDEEEKYHERASMTAQRKERILWLAVRIAKAGPWLTYNGKSFSADPTQESLETRSMTFGSATTIDPLGRAGTWSPTKKEYESAEEDLPSQHAAQIVSHD